MTAKSRDVWFRAWLLGCASAAGIFGQAAAQPTIVDIPQQPLATALRLLGQQTGTNLLFTSQEVAGLGAPALHGHMSAAAAAAALLAGSGLETGPDGSGGFIVRRSAPAPISLSPGPPTPTMPSIESVEVSASRIVMAGYTQPTPVTVLNSEKLARDAYSDIGDAIRALPLSGVAISPSNGVSSGIISGATAGTDTINLRNLGTQRTLVLFDGQRIVQSNITGGVDLNTVPTSLVERVDIVTGGASAAWGSDAVAGVVNLVVNRDFTGLRVNLEGADTGQNDRSTGKAEISWGTQWNQERGHLILSASYVTSPNAVFQAQRAWYTDTYLVNNPSMAAGAPRLVHVGNVGLSQATPGGVITASPAGPGGPADALRGIQFVGPVGTPTPFNPGAISGVLSSGGDADFLTGESAINLLAVPYRSATLYGYGSYQLASGTRLSLEWNYGKSFAKNDAQAAARLGDLTIMADNAFLDPTLKARLAALGAGSFTMGTTNTGGLDLSHPTVAAAAQSLGVPVNETQRQLLRMVASADGDLGRNWSWKSYAEHEQVRADLRVRNNVLNRNYLNATDAVLVTPANSGTSGLPLGSIVCRSSLTAPGNGCAPLDPFGTAAPSSAAIDYISPGTDYENILVSEDVLSVMLQGKLPSPLPAGSLAIALGGEYRDEAGRTDADSRGADMEWYSGNFTDFAGYYQVKEAFGEIQMPLWRGAAVRAVDANAAVRATDYSTSGLVETWKLGLTGDINDEVRLRGVWSLDIRAPDLSELFAATQINTSQATDPNTGAVVTVFTQRRGNPDLKPERAVTLSGGVVLTPTTLDGLAISLDWYAIDIHGAIYAPTMVEILRACEKGMAPYCSQLFFNGNAYPGALGEIDTLPRNLASITTSGLDVQLNYAMSAAGGRIQWALIGNYTDEQTQTGLGAQFDSAGSLGPDSAQIGMPKLRATLSATYELAAWSATVQGRFLGGGRLNNAWNEGVDVDDNSVPPVAYLDLRLDYRWTASLQLYAALDNLADVPPPVIAPSFAISNPYQNLDTRTDLYGALGRMIRIGLRFNS